MNHLESAKGVVVPPCYTGAAAAAPAHLVVLVDGFDRIAPAARTCASAAAESKGDAVATARSATLLLGIPGVMTRLAVDLMVLLALHTVVAAAGTAVVRGLLGSVGMGVVPVGVAAVRE
jgi:hypothetical protein